MVRSYWLRTALTLRGPMSSEPKRKRVTLAIGAAGVAILTAPMAHAGPWDDPSLNPTQQDYVNHGHNNICTWLDQMPGDAGVNQVISRVQSAGFNHRDAAHIINVSVAKTCPGHVARLSADGGVGIAPAHATGEWWDTPEQGQAVCSIVKAGGRDWAVNNGIGDLNGTAAGAHMVDTLISKYCPKYAR